MKQYFTQTMTLASSEVYLKRVSELTNEPVDRIRQAHYLLTSLISACLHKQLMTDIGRNLVHNLIVKRASEMELLALSTDLEERSVQGDKLFNRIVPGKKSAVVRITAYYTKLPFASIYPIFGLCADALFCDIHTSMKQHSVTTNDLYSLLPSPIELQRLAPQLHSKDYETIGVRSLMLQA